MTKYYRVTKDNFLWKEGAILKGDDGYRPIEDMWDTTKYNSTEYISAPIIENNPEWFERVYKNKFDKFLAKAEALSQFKDKMTS